MQLADAIEAWVEVHGRGLSASTRNDIAGISAAIDESGYGGWHTTELTASDRGDIAAEVAADTTLGVNAIGEFLQVVVRWSRAAAATTDERPDDPIEVREPTDAVDRPPNGTDPDVAERPPNVADAVDRPPNVADPDVDLAVAPQWSRHDDLPRVVVTADPTALGGPAVGDHQAASSFLEAIGSSAPPSDLASPHQVPEPPGEVAAPPSATGIFSTAAEERAPAPRSGVDWITVAYFTVAAICFALVIYFYLSS